MKSISTKVWLAIIFISSHFSAISQTNHVVISQLFGSGGTASNLPNNDFIELYNPTGTAVNMSGWSLQFAFGTATTYIKIPLSGFIVAKGYYLIELSRDAYVTGTTMPTPDLTYNYNINSADMKIGLYKFNSAVSGANPSSTSVDFIGTGVANGYEGSGTSPQGSYSVSLLRKSSSTSTQASMASGGAEYTKGNGWDTNNNAADLLLSSIVTPRSSNSSPLAVKFLSFDLGKTSTSNLLRWKVDAAQEVSAFDVEKSSDGISFSQIGQINPQANASYQFVDGNTISAYYRIKTISTDGKLVYSPTLFAEARETASMKLYPTVANESVVLQFPGSKQGDKVSIYGMDGRIQQQVIPSTGQTQTTLLVSMLKPGTYVVHYMSVSGKTSVERFIKAG